ncbi:MAG: NTP transferase domain-containing protein [Flavobacteriaceae bacterium]|nr:NTP transferase domain-containing protein [Flavobacteriaceae bacterium]
MGKPKGLLDFKGEYWLLHQINSFIGNDVFIGLGYDSEVYFNTIPWLKTAIEAPVNYKGKKVSVLINSQPEFGLFSNLQNLLKQVNKKQDIFVLPIDVPLLSEQEQAKIIATNNLIVIPKFENKKGHPVKLNALFWKSLLDIPIDNNEARLDVQIKKRNASEITILNVSDASSIKNLNTPKDWLEFIAL